MSISKLQRRLSHELSWTVGLSFLLGLTWLFGFFMIADDLKSLQYVFVVLATSQGIGVFVFQILMRKNVRDSVRKTLGFSVSDSNKTSTKDRHSCGSSQANETTMFAVSRSTSIQSRDRPHTSPVNDHHKVVAQSSIVSDRSSVAEAALVDSIVVTSSTFQSGTPRKESVRNSRNLHVHFEEQEEAVGRGERRELGHDSDHEEASRSTPLVAEYTAAQRQVHEGTDLTGLNLSEKGRRNSLRSVTV